MPDAELDVGSPHEIVGHVRADEYRRAADNLVAFMQAFGRLLSELEPSPGYGKYPQWKPRSGHEFEAGQLAREVARLAGPAAEAFQASGMLINYKPPGTWQTQAINPALAWSTIFDQMAVLDPHLMSVVGGQAVGWFEHRQREQAARQRGIIGAIAWFFTLAPRVRKAAGLPARSASGYAVTWATVVVQGLIVTVVGGVLVYPVAKAFGWID